MYFYKKTAEPNCHTYMGPNLYRTSPSRLRDVKDGDLEVDRIAERSRQKWEMLKGFDVRVLI